MQTIFSQIILQVVLILLNAFFAATEIALLSLSITKLRKMEEDGNRAAKRLIKLVEEPSGVLSTIQVGITLAGFLASAFAAENFSDPLVDWVYYGLGFQALPLPLLSTISVVLITILLAYFMLVLGELVPKRIAMQKPFEVARISCAIIASIAVVMKPVVRLLSASTNGVLRLLRFKTEADEDTVTEDEIRMMVDLGEERGTIDADEKEWIQNVFEFNDVSVCDAMTRTVDMESVWIEDTTADILDLIRQTGLSRFPVYGEDINDIRGILNSRDFLLALGEGKPCGVEALMREAYCVPESIRADQLFKDMQQKKVHIAVVIDEYGETCGIITIEDLLEQIVGNIYDEFDPAEPAEIEKLEDNLWRVSGGTRVEDLAEELEIDLPEDEDYDTVGGMVFSCLHTIPNDGDTLDVEVNGLLIHVEHVEDRRVEQALVRVAPRPPAEDEKE